MSEPEKPKRRGPEYRLDFYPADFLAATAFLSGEERALYLLTLMVLAWPNGARLPNDPEAIRRACGYEAESFGRLWPRVAEKWRPGEDGMLHQGRLDREWTKDSAYFERQRALSAKGGEANRQRLSDSPPDSPPDEPTGQPTGQPRARLSPSPSPSTSTKRSSTEPPSASTSRMAARALFERLREEDGENDFFERFMADPITRVMRELMEERPAVFEHCTIEDFETLCNGGILRGTKHDRKAVLLWARDPEAFMRGGV